MRNTKVKEEQILSASDEKYTLLKKELVRMGGCLGTNRFIRDKDGRPVETTDDYLVWLYDVFLQLSMLELSCTGDTVVPGQIAMIKDAADRAEHESIVDVIQEMYGDEVKKVTGDDGRRIDWDEIIGAKASSVRRMVVIMKKNLREQAESFCDAFATAVAANGGNAFEMLKESTTLALAECAAADGEVTPEEEDKLSYCFIVALINDIARRLVNFTLAKKF